MGRGGRMKEGMVAAGEQTGVETPGTVVAGERKGSNKKRERVIYGQERESDRQCAVPAHAI